jgi:hypothetical protein
LLEYASYLLQKKGFEAYTGESFVEWKSEMVIVKKRFGADYFPQHFVALFTAFASNDVNTIINRINNCQKVINGGVCDNINEDPVIIIPTASKHIHVEHSHSTHTHTKEHKRHDKEKKQKEKEKKKKEKADKHKHKHKH